MPTDKSKPITIRLQTQEIEALDAYTSDNKLNRTQAFRVALLRLLKSKPTKKERAETERDIGSPILKRGGPEASKQGSRAAAKRHHPEG